MRKLNTILSVLLLFICLLHGLMGSFMLLGISSGAGKFLAWIGVGILAAHTVLGLLLTAQTFRASRSGGKLYGKQNGENGVQFSHEGSSISSAESRRMSASGNAVASSVFSETSSS